MNARQGRLNDSRWLALLPRGLRFESQLAVRHLRSGGKQTLLTISAVAAGVIIVVFVTALIFGLQRRWTDILTEAIPHVTIRVVDPKPMPLAAVPGAPSGAVSSRIEQRAPQEKNIENWAQVVEVVHTLSNIRVVAPVVRGQAFASKGGNPYGVSVVGADPDAQDQVTPGDQEPHRRPLPRPDQRRDRHRLRAGQRFERQHRRPYPLDLEHGSCRGVHNRGHLQPGARTGQRLHYPAYCAELLRPGHGSQCHSGKGGGHFPCG